MAGALPINAVNSVKLPSLAGEKNAKMKGEERKKERDIYSQSLHFWYGLCVHAPASVANQNVLYLSLSLLVLFPHFGIYFA